MEFKEQLKKYLKEYEETRYDDEYLERLKKAISNKAKQGETMLTVELEDTDLKFELTSNSLLNRIFRFKTKVVPTNTGLANLIENLDGLRLQTELHLDSYGYNKLARLYIYW
jgi:hypothetical protein